jgi:NitT/TauT family transport system substrate-binding protein
MANGSRYKLTTFSKILILVLVLALIAGGIFVGVQKGVIKTKKGNTAGVTPDADGNIINTEKTSEDTINLSVDEWIGYKSILDANGGLTTQPGSIYDNLGVSVNISVINDATQSSSALISGDLDAAGYTVNRTAFLQNKFATAGVDVIMPYVTNYSNGGDGIIAKSNINTVEDLVGAKIGVPEFSESQTLVVWFVNNSDLSDKDKQSIIDNLILFATPDDCAKAFFAGEIDVAATWEPYLTQAQNMSDAHIFFSTAYSSSLVLSGIVFDKEFAEAHSDTVTKFIQGTLMASDLYETNMDVIKAAMPMFSTASNQDILDNCAGAKLTTYADNMKLLGDGGTAKTMYMDMCDIWNSLGETADSSTVNDIFTTAYIAPLSSEFSSTEVTKTDAITDATTVDKNTLTSDEMEAILDGTANVTFVKNTATFDDPAAASETLDNFIKNAKILDGSIIVLEGNTDPNPESDPEDTYNKQLSESRANAVKNYFIMNGIDANRIVTVGNGSSKPLYDNDTEEHRALNRRTDISFKVIEQ